MPGINQELLDKILRYQIDLRRVEARTKREILEVLQTLQGQLLGELASGEIRTFSKARTQELINKLSPIIAEHYIAAEAELNGQLDELAEIQVAQAERALKTTVFIESDVILPSDTLIKRIARNVLIEGGPLADWWKRQTQDIQFKLGGAIREGVLLNETNDQIISKVIGRGNEPGILPQARNRAAALVQTAVHQVNNDARNMVYERNNDIIKALIHLSTLDSHTSIICVGRSGLKWRNDKDHKPIGHTIPFQVPPLHFNCLPGDTDISSCEDVTGTSKRRFDGKIIVIETSSGRKLSCTPNHPILTGHGWVKAGELHKGCNVFSSPRRDRIFRGTRNGEDVPTRIHNFVKSFLASREVSAMPVPVSAEDFHGDGVGSKVAVVYSDRFLMGRLDSSFAEKVSEQYFIRGYFALRYFLGSRGFFKSGPFSGFSSCSAMSIMQEFHSFFFGRPGHSCKLLFAPISETDPSILENPFNYFRGAIDLFGDSRDTYPRVVEFLSLFYIYLRQFSGGVFSKGFETSEDRLYTNTDILCDSATREAHGMFLDDIVDMKVVDFHDYVYNVETKKGWYVANGIVTHNCRSVMIPETLTFREMGLDMPEPEIGERASSLGPLDANTTMDQYLNRVSESQQNEMLGKGRADLWRRGKITLSQLLDGRGRELTLQQLRDRHL